MTFVRRAAAIVALAVVIVSAAATAEASVTVGSTLTPSTVAVRVSGRMIAVRYTVPGTREVKFWSAGAYDLTRASYHGLPLPWVSGTSCATKITVPAAADVPAGVPARALTGSHAMTTLGCTVLGYKVYVQIWHQQAPDFGTPLTSDQPYTVNVSSVSIPEYLNTVSPNPDGTPAMQVGAYDLPTIGPVSFDGWPILQAQTRWSKFSPGGYQGYLAGRHFTTLFGSFTYGGVGVWGPADRGGNPTNKFGRNAYIDTYDSDFGDGWRRAVGVLTQKPNGTFCYEFSKKGGSAGMTGASQPGVYSVTVQGPGSAPDQRAYFTTPTFAFGNDAYVAKTDKWGTNFSDGQAQALRNQAAMMGPDFRRPVRGTDCAQQLRQLPESFFAAG